MPLAADLRLLYRLALAPIRGTSHAERSESFYRDQADHYDRSRAGLLHGRREMMEWLPVPDAGVWVEMGGGTGENVEHLGERRARLSKVYLVDLSPSLLDIARWRKERLGWSNVEIVRADATTFEFPSGPVDVVTFSYSLTMIPDWFAAVDRAWELLRPGGAISVVDFHVSRKHPAPGRTRHLAGMVRPRQCIPEPRPRRVPSSPLPADPSLGAMRQNRPSPRTANPLLPVRRNQTVQHAGECPLGREERDPCRR